ncbi:MAG: hypothetical protein BJ554DRAFT_1949, partial [Olpidium bornovanus]
SSSIGGLRGGLFYWSAPGFGSCPAFDPAAASALRLPFALCPSPAVLRPPPFARRPPSVASVNGRFEGRRDRNGVLVVQKILLLLRNFRLYLWLTHCRWRWRNGLLNGSHGSYLQDELLNELGKLVNSRAVLFTLTALLTSYGALSSVLCMQILRDKNLGAVHLVQRHYTQVLLNRFNHADAHLERVPLDPSAVCSLGARTDAASTIEKAKFAELIGSLLYLSTRTRSDIAAAVGFPFMLHSQRGHRALERFKA